MVLDMWLQYVEKGLDVGSERMLSLDVLKGGLEGFGNNRKKGAVHCGRVVRNGGRFEERMKGGK